MSAYNGSGTFVVSGAGLPYVTATTISSTVANQLNTDLATGLSTAICKDGQSTPIANIPFGGFKLTGVGAATVAGDALSYGGANGTKGLVGTATNDDAITGNIGEYVSGTASGVALSNGVNANVTTISLTAGDWDVSGTVKFVPAGATVTGYAAAVSSTSATLPAISAGGYSGLISTAFPSGSTQILPTPTYRITLAVTTTVYLVAESDFTAGSIAASGFIRARRVR